MTDLYWVNGPWQGRLALSSRPRGGDWLYDELAGWRRAGIDTLLSLLTPDEEASLEVLDESLIANSQGIRFLSLPIPDRQVPADSLKAAAMIEELDAELAAGKNVVIHCRQGIGRTGLIAAALLIARGIDPQKAVETISAARGVPVPETKEQREWVDHFAALAGTAK